jgi:hypothetical protein
LILEKALNKRILDKIEKIKNKDGAAYNLLRKALWQEYLNRTKQTWHYSQWYLKQIEKEVSKEG